MPGNEALELLNRDKYNYYRSSYRNSIHIARSSYAISLNMVNPTCREWTRVVVHFEQLSLSWASDDRWMDSAKRGKAHATSSGLLSASDMSACKFDSCEYLKVQCANVIICVWGGGGGGGGLWLIARQARISADLLYVPSVSIVMS